MIITCMDRLCYKAELIMKCWSLVMFSMVCLLSGIMHVYTMMLPQWKSIPAVMLALAMSIVMLAVFKLEISAIMT